jgi:PHD/YefM family antitoxin component YafN of YafNO toxin-antitoxin module
MPGVPLIRPVAEFRYKFNDIANLVHETDEPVFLTVKGRIDLVVMSTATYEKDFAHEVYGMLKEAEGQVEATARRHSHAELMSRLRQMTKRPVGVGSPGGLPPDELPPDGLPPGGQPLGGQAPGGEPSYGV